MLISDRIGNGHPLFSFEFFPPKSSEGDEKLWEVLTELKPLQPAFVSVTYGAGGSTRVKTIELVSRIKSELGIEAMAHLTCVGAKAGELEGILKSLHGQGIQNIMALRGDPPKGKSQFLAEQGGFSYASELVGLIRTTLGQNVCIGGACYPEGHVEAPSKDEDLHNLKRKVEAGVNFLVTQLFFDNRVYFDFVDRARAQGIDVPIVPGIMPITNYEQIRRFTKLCGATIPPPLLEELEKRKDDPERVQELGIIHATIQSLGLIQGGAPGIHFYTLNKSSATRAILSAIRMNARI